MRSRWICFSNGETDCEERGKGGEGKRERREEGREGKGSEGVGDEIHRKERRIAMILALKCIAHVTLKWMMHSLLTSTLG